MPKLKTGVLLLKFNNLSSAAGAKAYYQPQYGDYYLAENQSLPLWGGKGAELLGLSGAVNKKDFDRLIDNLHPTTSPLGNYGEPARLTGKTFENRRVAYDLTFHSFKALSLLSGLRNVRQIEAIERECIQEVMVEIERDAVVRIRKRGVKDEDRLTGNLIWCDVGHATARPVLDGDRVPTIGRKAQRHDGESVPDPHDHRHVVVFNASYDAEEGQWKAVDLGMARRDASYYEAMYSQKVACRLQALGLTIVPGKGYSWNIDGIDDELLKKFSRRTAQVEATASASNELTDAQRAALGRLTRSPKGPEQNAATLRGLWLARLSAADEIALDAACAQISHQPTGPRSPEASRELARTVLAEAIEDLSATASVWRERQLLAVAMYRSRGSCTKEDLHEALNGMDIVRREMDGETWYTTQTLLEEEKLIVAFVRAGRDRFRPFAPWVPSLLVEGLSDEQRRAVELLAKSSDQVLAVHGRAGTGKTTIMGPAIDLMRAARMNVVTVAPTGRARDILKKDGFDAHTLEKLLVSPKLQSNLKDGVLWVDEAGLVSVPQMRRVFELAARCNCRVILGGDIAQHNSVERGDALRLLLEFGGLQRADVSTIRRQRKEWHRAAVEDLSEGHASPRRGRRALDTLVRHGAIRECADEEERYRMLAADLLSSLRDGKTAMAIAPTHNEINRVTQAVRQLAFDSGQLGKTATKLERLTRCNWSGGDLRNPANYSTNHLIEFVRDSGRFRCGERLRVSAVVAGNIEVTTSGGESASLALSDVDAFNVYERDTFEVRTGDKVRLTANSVTRDKRHLLPNGAIHTVNEVRSNGGIVLDNGAELSPTHGHITMGWACTSIAAQGSTVDQVLVCQSAASGAAANAEQLYVSASRGRDGVTIYTDNRDSLYAAVGRTSARTLATELANTRRLSPGEVRTRWRRNVALLALATNTARLPGGGTHGAGLNTNGSRPEGEPKAGVIRPQANSKSVTPINLDLLP